MRILLVNKFAYVTGGADRHCLALARLLRERGHEVALLSTASERNLEREGIFVPCTVTHETRDALPLRARALAARRAFWNAQAAAAMRTAVDRFRPDVVHAHKLYPQLSVAPIVAAARANVPIVQTLHDYEFISASFRDARGRRFDEDDSRRSYRLLNAALLGVHRSVHAPRVRLWIAPSEYIATVHRARGIDPVVLPNFAEANGRVVVRPLDERSGIAFVGRLAPEKGIPDVLELARRLSPTPVTIAGDGPLAGDVTTSARELANVTYVGSLDRGGVADLLARSRVCVMPSRWEENAPMTALEAMSAGTPLVAYRRGGLPEYIEGAAAGVVVPTGVAGLEDACAGILRDAEEWERLSAGGVDAVARTYSPERYAERLEGLYERASA